MNSRGITQRRSSNEAAPSGSSKMERAMRRTWRATEVPSSFLSMRPASTRASPKRFFRSPLMRADTRSKSSPVIRPRATRASPRRSFLRLLAAKTMRP